MPSLPIFPPKVEAHLKEFSDVADDWFSGRTFIAKYHRFIEEFFNPDNLAHAEWPAFQQLADHLHSLNSVALAKGNAFGRPNYPIEKYRDSFGFLAHGQGEVEDRMRAFMGDKEAYASRFLGNSIVSELIGQIFAEQYVFMNRRDIEAAEYLGFRPNYSRGDDFPTRFSKFNAAIKPLFEAYRELVEQRTDVPLGLEVDQFLSWIYETKISKRQNDASSRSNGPQIWVFAPGPQARFWDECRSESIAVFGVEPLGPLSPFQSKEEILQRLKEIAPGDTEPTNDARAAWEFCNVMKEGDLVIAKKGNRKIVGLGTVIGPYRYDDSRKEYRNVRDVEWTHEGEWLLPDGDRFATKTLTNITSYKDFTTKIMNLLGVEPKELPPDTGTRYFWLNCDPDVWKLSQYQVGGEQTYTTHNEKGNKRRVYTCFQAVKPGDRLVGYETSPILKVTSVLEVTNGIHHDETEGECIRFKVLRHLEHPRTLQELRDMKALTDCDPVIGTHQGSLFQLTSAEYEAIVGKTPPEEPTGATEPNPYTVEDALGTLFVEKATFREWLRQWQVGKNLILQGPPGVGKTYVARRLAYALMGEEAPQRVAMVQFHQSYGYEDFVQGIRPVRIKEGDRVHTGFDLRNGTFYNFCIQAKSDPRPHVFIIDEINRGNLSRIFGELLMLIEADKRGEGNALRLAYQEEEQTFFVPENVYLLGMMNTADRSLAVVDYALRRRFRFATLLPAFETSAFREHLSEACGEDLSDRILLVLQRLNQVITKDTANLGPGFCVGHSYFCQIKSAEDYREVIHFQIAPLLREYWFDQPRKAEDSILELLSI